MGYKFYRNSLNDFEKNLYDEILAGLLTMQTKISLKFNKTLKVSKIYYAVLFDNPFIYYAGGFKYSYIPILCQHEIFPEYLIDISKKQNLDKKIHEIGNMLLNKCVNSDIFETILKFHDIIGKNVIYEDIDMNSHSILGVLLNKKGVCEGIAKTFKYLCDKVGIECIYVHGKAKGDVNSINHSWNKVKINDKWYNVDVTYDMKKEDFPFVKHDYFLLSDKKIENTHIEINVFEKIRCYDEKLTFYETKKCIVNSRSEMVEFIKKKILQKELIMEFKLSYVKNITDLIKELKHSIHIVYTKLMLEGQYVYSYNEELMNVLIKFEIN